MAAGSIAGSPVALGGRVHHGDRHAHPDGPSRRRRDAGRHGNGRADADGHCGADADRYGNPHGDAAPTADAHPHRDAASTHADAHPHGDAASPNPRRA